jgi:hypothetical protein
VTRLRGALLAAGVIVALIVGAVLVGRGDDAAPDRGGTASSDTPADGGDRTDEAPPQDEPDGGDTDDAGSGLEEVPETEGPGLADPVTLDAPADFGDGVVVRLSGIRATQVEGRMPGEFSGPGIDVTVEMTNRSDRTIDVGNVTVALIDGGGDLAIPIQDPQRPELRGSLAPGESRTGTYLFYLPPEDRSGATVTISYAAGAPVVQFIGDLPRD